MDRLCPGRVIIWRHGTVSFHRTFDEDFTGVAGAINQGSIAGGIGLSHVPSFMK